MTEEDFDTAHAMYTYNHTDHKVFKEKDSGTIFSILLCETEGVQFAWKDVNPDNSPNSIIEKKPFYTVPGKGDGVTPNFGAMANEWTTRIVGYVGANDHSSGKNFVTSDNIFAEYPPNEPTPHSTGLDSMFNILTKIVSIVLPVSTANAPGPGALAQNLVMVRSMGSQWFDESFDVNVLKSKNITADEFGRYVGRMNEEFLTHESEYVVNDL